jgi:pimeloyl-ACP methyl ester carboxylesterase
MNDPCNLAENQRPQFLGAPCTPSYPYALTNIGSDWNDVGAAVDYIRLLRRVDRVSLVAWSLGGPRAGGYAAQNPSKVNRLVVLAPAYNPKSAPEAPKLPAEGTTFNTQSRAEFDANWDRQVGCPDQYDRAVSDSVWSAMIDSDTLARRGAWRPPRAADDDLGWNQATVAKTMTPTLMVAGIHDKQGAARSCPSAVYGLGAPQKGAHRFSAARRTTRCGEESSRAVPRLARMARERDGERRQGRRLAARLLVVRRSTINIGRSDVAAESSRSWLRVIRTPNVDTDH